MKSSKAIRSILAICAVSVGVMISSISAFAATGKATDTGVNIRESASTDAKAIGSTTKGIRFDIHSKTKDSAGNEWYKITVTGDTKGYIRADYVIDIEGSVPNEDGSASTSETAPAQNEEPAEVTTTQVNASAYSFGTTTGEVSVRETASTKANKVTTTAANQDVEITGETTGADGKVWYQIGYGDIRGFIRSDLITVGEPSDVDNTQEPLEGNDVVDEDATVTLNQNQDYELKYEANQEGQDVWYLYDHTKGTRQTLDNIFALIEQGQLAAPQAQQKGAVSKVVVIIMGIVIALLIGAVAFLAFKLREAYGDWDEEDEEDEEQDDDDEEEDGDDDDEEEDEEDDIKIVTKRGKAKKASLSAKPSKNTQSKGESWKSNKFFEIDDDVEFEFLDIDK